MRRIVISIVAIVFIGISMFAQNSQSEKFQQGRAEIMNRLSYISGVSITYLTESSLKRLNKDKTNSPLAQILEESGVNSIRVFELESSEAQEAGKSLLNLYISENPDIELFHLQRDSSKEVMLYAISDPRFRGPVKWFETVLMYSKTHGKKAILIILSGRIDEDTIGNLIASFSE